VAGVSIVGFAGDSIAVDPNQIGFRLARMPATTIRELVPVLQVAIGPVILISGVGLLLLTLTNRFGRAVDRSRQLAREMRDLPEVERQRLANQVDILYQRAGLIRLAVITSAVSVLLAAVLIISLFVSALVNFEMGAIIILEFIGCMLSLIMSLSAFIREIQLSLMALKLELGRQG
jgi:hypothetical protein